MTEVWDAIARQENDVRIDRKPSKQGLSREDIAERWGTTTRTIDRYQKVGKLPPPDYYIGKRPRWIEHKVEPIADDGKHGRGSAKGLPSQAVPQPQARSPLQAVGSCTWMARCPSFPALVCATASSLEDMMR
jgi:hypothetical protein